MLVNGFKSASAKTIGLQSLFPEEAVSGFLSSAEANKAANLICCCVLSGQNQAQRPLTVSALSQKGIDRVCALGEGCMWMTARTWHFGIMGLLDALYRAPNMAEDS